MEMVKVERIISAYSKARWKELLPKTLKATYWNKPRLKSLLSVDFETTWDCKKVAPLGIEPRTFSLNCQPVCAYGHETWWTWPGGTSDYVTTSIFN